MPPTYTARECTTLYAPCPNCKGKPRARWRCALCNLCGYIRYSVLRT